MPRKLLLFSAVGALALTAAGAGEAGTLTGNLTADNAFFAFISSDNSVLGTQIGSGADWGSAFSVNKTLPAGTYYLQIEAINQGGPGGFIGDFWADGVEFITGDAGWTASYASDNSDASVQPWVEPTGGVISYGANGVGPWGTVLGVNGNAQWLDSADGGLVSNGGFATVDFSYRFTVAGGVPEPATWAMMGVGFAGLAFAAALGKRKGVALAA